LQEEEKISILIRKLENTLKECLEIKNFFRYSLYIGTFSHNL